MERCELLKVQRRLISLEDMVANHYEVLNMLCKDLADIEKKWYSSIGLELHLSRVLKDMDTIKDDMFGNQEFLERKMNELEEQHKNFIKYHESHQYHTDKKTKRYLYNE